MISISSAKTGPIASLVTRLLLVLLLLYFAVAGVACLLQGQMIFPGQNLGGPAPEQIKRSYPYAEEVRLETPDTVILHGWLVHGHAEKPSPLIIYFGGNAEEVSGMLQYHRQLSEWSMLLVNYRGFGLSEGKPGEEALLKDGLLLYDHFSRWEEVDQNRIVVMGRSLGTAVAVHVSANRPVQASVLISPFRSIENIARRSFPILPVGLLLRHTFNVLPHAASAENPMLSIAAAEDKVVPLEESERLFDAWKGEKIFRILHGSDHNTIVSHPDYWSVIRGFLHKQQNQ